MYLITYDNIGNPTSIGNKTLTWMNGRELAIYSDGTNNISYKYNQNGIRTSKTINNITTNYYVEGRNIIFEERNGTMLYYLYNGDELLGFIYNNNTYYYHKNLFGDIIGIYDSNYNEIVTYKYNSWGVIKNITDNSNINLGIINPFRYRSYYYDEETQLYYLNSRYYNPVIGRFINADSYVSTGQSFIGNNMFNYCGNNPVNRLEITGNFWELALICTAIGALYGIVGQGAYNAVAGNNITDGWLAAGFGGAVGGFMSVVAPEYIFIGALYGSTAGASINYIQGKTTTEEYIDEIAIGTIANTLVGKSTSSFVKNRYTSTTLSTIGGTVVSSSLSSLNSKNENRSYVKIKNSSNNHIAITENNLILLNASYIPIIKACIWNVKYIFNSKAKRIGKGYEDFINKRCYY